MQVQKVVRCHFSCSAQVTSSSDGGVVGSGARVEVMGEIGLEVGKDEADEAESGVEAAAGSCGVKQCTAVKRRKRWNANDRRIDVIAATVESALEPENEVERKRASERRGDLEKSEFPNSSFACCTCGARIGGHGDFDSGSRDLSSGCLLLKHYESLEA